MFYYKLKQILLQLGAASLLQIGASIATNWGSYYKLEQPLLQNRATITNWSNIYYKLGQVLQVRGIITNWGHNSGCLLLLLHNLILIFYHCLYVSIFLYIPALCLKL